MTMKQMDCTGKLEEAFKIHSGSFSLINRHKQKKHYMRSLLTFNLAAYLLGDQSFSPFWFSFTQLIP